MPFVHLHTHSEYSWLDGACIIKDLVDKAHRHLMPAVAITDRNSIDGAAELARECHKAGLKPIIGLEIEVWNDRGDDRAFSVILLAKTAEGFLNLERLIALAREHDPQAPRITKYQLQTHATGLICLSFSVVGELCTLLLEGRDEEAGEVSDWYKNVFGEDYYYEIQDHGLPREAIAMNKLLNLAYYRKIPVVLTNDCHYLERWESSAIDALNCIRKGLDFSHPEAKRFSCNEYYFKPPKEMQDLVVFPPELITNTCLIADSIELDLLKYLADNPQSPPNGYQKWDPSSIYEAVLQDHRVPPQKIKQLVQLIPRRSRTLSDAILKSTDFSCLVSEDLVCRNAKGIAMKLEGTFRKIP